MNQHTEHPLVGGHLYLDCFSGIAGDMFLGALIDLGVPESWLRSQLKQLPFDEYELHVGERKHHSIVGCDVKVTPSAAASQTHRRYQDIRQSIAHSGLPAEAKRVALAIFDKVARAEARLHGTTVAEVTFHEVGAIDSIVDVVGAALALTYLRPARVSARAVPLGSGLARGAHGGIPLPSPAAVEILRGALVEQGPEGKELCTPTGAAIIATIVEEFGPLPRGRVLAVGYGAGDCELADRPNHLRAILLADQPAASGRSEELVLVETNVDDMTPEIAAYVTERMLAEGARDAWQVPIVMKKGRPALKIAALCDVAERERVISVLLQESTAIGVRCTTVERRTLARRVVTVDTPFGPQSVKEARDGALLRNAAPEYESCRETAMARGVPLKQVYAATMSAYWAAENDERAAGATPAAEEQGEAAS